MALFINTTETIGIIMGEATAVTFGAMFLTLFFVLIVILAIALMFGIRLEYTAILVLPLVLVYMAYYSEFYATGGVLIIYLAFILTKNFIFK